MKKCVVCGVVFTPKRSDQKICRSEECIKAQSKAWNENRKKSKPAKRRKRCSECNKLFKPKHSMQKTCGSELCIKSRKNSRRKKEEHEYNCQVCGDKTWSARENAVLCGKKSCRDSYRNEFNKNGKYKEKLRDSIKKKAKVSGKYSDEEVDFIIRNKLNGKSYVFIAKKLKRTYISVEKKCSTIFSDPKYSSLIEGIRYEIELENEESRKKPKNESINYWNERLSNVFNK